MLYLVRGVMSIEDTFVLRSAEMGFNSHCGAKTNWRNP